LVIANDNSASTSKKKSALPGRTLSFSRHQQRGIPRTSRRLSLPFEDLLDHPGDASGHSDDDPANVFVHIFSCG
jgi:hypothetical protein